MSKYSDILFENLPLVLWSLIEGVINYFKKLKLKTMANKIAKVTKGGNLNKTTSSGISSKGVSRISIAVVKKYFTQKTTRNG